jgi:pimeloyl-ACP methyl ester carboxylesterase
MVYSDMYFPIRWPRLAQALEFLITGNATGILTQLASAATGSAGESPPDADAILGIKCGDKQIRSETIGDVMPGVNARWALSRLGGDISDISAIQCSRWKMDAKERYTGDFRVDPAHPVLLISTQNDPVSPLASAKNMSSSWKGGVILEQEGYGVGLFLFHSCL